MNKLNKFMVPMILLGSTLAAKAEGILPLTDVTAGLTEAKAGATTVALGALAFVAVLMVGGFVYSAVSRKGR